MLTDARGVPLAVAVDGANRHDIKLLRATLESNQTPRPDDGTIENLCMDKGFDYPEVRELAEEFGFIAHIVTRGQEKEAKTRIPRYRARRWVVERTHSWINRFRRLLVRWEKKKANYLAMIHIACAVIAFRAAGVLG